MTTMNRLLFNLVSFVVIHYILIKKTFASETTEQTNLYIFCLKKYVNYKNRATHMTAMSISFN